MTHLSAGCEFDTPGLGKVLSPKYSWCTILARFQPQPCSYQGRIHCFILQASYVESSTLLSLSFAGASMTSLGRCFAKGKPSTLSFITFSPRQRKTTSGIVYHTIITFCPGILLTMVISAASVNTFSILTVFRNMAKILIRADTIP